MTAIHRYPTILALTTILLLVGCAGPTPEMDRQQYTLVPASTSVSTDERHGAVDGDGPVLRVAEIRAPAWLNSTQMYYRLDYETGAEIAPYNLTEWVAPPPVLLAEVLQGELARMTRWKAVVSPDVVADADLTLRVTLNGFQQVFASPTRSTAVVDATATLLSGTVIAQRRFHVTAPAPTADAQGGVKALSQASRELARRIRKWISLALSQGK